MKVAVLVSGGVDSSVALRLLQQQGHDVTAFYLKIWLEDELSYLGNCPWEEDLAYVQAVCTQAGVPLQIVPLQKEYHEQVVAYTIAEVKAGRTPNPDMLCNQRIKFGMFFNAIGDHFEKITTGHYAQIAYEAGRFCVRQAPDPVKDQSYFLSQLSQAQLSRILFPLGHLCKSEVRAMAHAFDVPNKDRKDSQGICFLGKLKFKDFVKHYVGERAGAMVEFETHVSLGEHQGVWFYTVGQRQGLGLAGGPWYVVAKDIVRNILYLSRHYYASDKKRDTFSIASCNWITRVPVDGPIKVKMRHGPQVHDAVISMRAPDAAQLVLAERDQGIAAGQFAVLYDHDGWCLGGGVIEETGIKWLHKE